MKYMKRPFFRYLARWKRHKDLVHKQHEEQRLWQQLLAEKLAERQAMTAVTEHRMPAVKVEDVPTNRLQRLSSTTLERLTTRQEAPYCVLPHVPLPNDDIRITDPMARIPKPLFANPMYIEHQRVLAMFRTAVETFFTHYGYLPVGLRVSQKTMRIMWILNFDYYAWRGHMIPLVLDILSERLPDDQVECLHPQEGDSERPTGGIRRAPATRRLHVTEIQEQQLQGTR